MPAGPMSARFWRYPAWNPLTLFRSKFKRSPRSNRETAGGEVWADSAAGVVSNGTSSFGVGQGSKIYQDVRVKPDTKYKLTGWVNSAALGWRRNIDGQDIIVKLCAQTTSGNSIMCSRTPNENRDVYTLTVDFDSGNNSTISVYAYTNNNNETWWDDFNLSEKQTTNPTTGAYSFTNSVMSGNSTATLTNLLTVLYSTTGIGTYNASPTLNITETSSPPGRTKYLYALVVPPPTPTVTPPAPSGCISNNYDGSGINFSWANNSVAATSVDISADRNFTNFYTRYGDFISIPNQNVLVTGPASFYFWTGQGKDTNNPLILNPDTNYYARLWDGYNHSTTGDFSIPLCPNPPAGPPAGPPAANSILPWIQTIDGDVHSNTNINLPRGN